MQKITSLSRRVIFYEKNWQNGKSEKVQIVRVLVQATEHMLKND
jgi:hypothetical protein